MDDDLDQDGFLLVNDCDDTNPEVNPDQDEIVYNGLDDDCDTTTLDDDLDQDGFLLVDDCDDTNPDINPDAMEIPNNGIDEDCDGEDLVTSIRETSLFKIDVFPNPAKELVNIDVPQNLSVSFNLFDLNGQLVFAGKENNKIYLENLPEGIYLLEITERQTGQKVLKKVVVVK